MTTLTVPSARSAEIQLQTLWPHSNKPSTMTGRKSPRETCTWGCLEGELIWMRELSVARDMLLVFTGTCLTTHSEASTSSSPKSQTHFGHWNFGDSSSMAGTLTTGNKWYFWLDILANKKRLTIWQYVGSAHLTFPTQPLGREGVAVGENHFSHASILDQNSQPEG